MDTPQSLMTLFKYGVVILKPQTMADETLLLRKLNGKHPKPLNTLCVYMGVSFSIA